MEVIMATAKRIFLFLAVNMLIMLTITISVNIILAFLGISPQSMYQFLASWRK